MAEKLTQRQSLRLMGLTRPSFVYKPKPDRNVRLKERILEVAGPGRGYLSAWLDLKEEFHPLSQKRVCRAWKQLDMAPKTKFRKKRTGTPMPGSSTVPNEVWSLDFVHDSCLNGTKLKVLAVIDEFTRECLALEAAASIKSASVQKILAGLFKERGAPKSLRSDNGPEFIARSLCVWLSLHGTQSRFIKPGSPWMNGKVESFNSRLRAEFLNVEVFHNLADAQVKLSMYKKQLQQPKEALCPSRPDSSFLFQGITRQNDGGTLLFSMRKKKGAVQAGPEFIAHSRCVWPSLLGTLCRYSKPRSHLIIGKVESFTFRRRAELIDAEVFHNLGHAQVKLSVFRNYYNIEGSNQPSKPKLPLHFSRHQKPT